MHWVIQRSQHVTPMPLSYVTFGPSHAYCVFSGTTVTYVAAGFAVTEEELEKLKDEEKWVGRPKSSPRAVAHNLSLPLSRTT